MLVLGDVAVNADMQRWDSRVRSERASLARLEAEQSGAAAVVFPPDVLDAARSDAGLAELLSKETCTVRRAARRLDFAGGAAALPAASR